MVSGLRAGHTFETGAAELYAADAGVQEAMWRIQGKGERGALPGSCGEPTRSYPAITVNGKTVTYNITYVNNITGTLTYKIVSVATSGDGSSTRIDSYVSYGSDWGEILDYGVLALDGKISIKGGSILDSFPEERKTHVCANGNIEISQNGKVYGRATATGTIDRKENVDPGPALEGQPPMSFVLPDTQKYLEAANEGELIEGNLKVNASRTLGPARITGNLEIEAQAVVTLGGPVWVDGTLSTAGGSVIKGEGPLVAVQGASLSGSAQPLADKMPVIISTRGPIVAGGTTESYMVLYAPQGKITLGGSVDIQGAVIGKEVEINVAKKVRVCYNTLVVARVRVYRTTVTSWEVSRG